jgi:hypothetical protein
MGSAYSSIGFGLSANEAINSAVAWMFAHGYNIKEKAETFGEPHRILFQVEGCGWHECKVEVTLPKSHQTPPTYIASFVYFARTQEELRRNLNNARLSIKPWAHQSSE